MQRRQALALGALAPFAAARSPLAQTAADWPSQPVRLIVPFAAGGPTDIPARLVADEMSRQLPNRIVVENRTGSGIIIGTDIVAKAPKDGLTVLYSTIGHAVVRALFPRVTFDPVADFAPVALVGKVPMIMMVNKDFPARTLPEFIALIRANPGKYDYASSGNGGAVHLATELFLHMAGGLRMNHIAFRGSAPAMPDLLAGRIPMLIDVAAGAIPIIQRGDLRPLAISTRERSSLVPDVPTFIEGGVADYEAYTWHMLLVPSGTPVPVINAINAAANRALEVEAVRNRLTEMTVEVVRGSTPASAAAFLAAEIAKWEPVIAAAGIKVD
ncbi:tripartite tricarboxylate transporter substrate binding protein [Roseococcus sp. SYP-B2431]|uniref:Bug family tripartite tricarboxylate transporter substrate binding protein n=1 Tax=Roseococcus sp. SYP-B2431 TaxID=2496640 RepID=UPI001039E168|nr:tripartite tricarboxylate transporter substrate-binding protein [Roseococcus sp. SYP-B2431]TCH96132.1 tripartite tricarboxylate transporter substrate binding protein [Roseococcus sp. SYP-B2431]